MNEADLKRDLVDTMKQMVGGVTFRHEDKFTAGIPDISNTSRMMTTWIEAKHVTPDKPFRDADRRSLQNFRARELNRHGHCFYVFYLETKEGKFTAIKSPEEVHNHGAEIILSTIVATGHDHVFVCQYLLRLLIEYKGPSWS